ncbi:MAG: acyl-CoA dehydratase activase-related protein [Halothermotrichaceae bacterium]
MSKVKIGIPKALLYTYYISFWKPFFKKLGMEVVIPGNTNKQMVDIGVKNSVSEICVPIKVYIGHTLNLLEKDVDYIFVPRFESIRKNRFFCPKFMGLPDMIKHGVKKVKDKLLSCSIKTETDDISDYRNYLSLLNKLDVTEKEVKNAAVYASEKWNKFRSYNKMGYTAVEANQMVEKDVSVKDSKQFEHNSNIKIGLMGYVYNLYDDFISMDITSKLRDMGIDFITFDMMEEKELEESIAHMHKKLFWTFSNKVLGAGYKLFHSDSIDGIIHVTAFGCGPDSFLGKLFELESDKTGVPFMTIRIDEHTGNNHLQTRIEAFIDMLKRKKSNAVS